MAGSILGQDQVKKINAAYPALVAHIRALLTADKSAYGLMKVHVLSEYLDTTELARIFQPLGFISPAEKRALVRAAIYEVLVTEGEKLVIGFDPGIDLGTAVVHAESHPDGKVSLKEFNPPAFRLNVQPADAFHGQKPADTAKPAPIVTNTAGTVAQKVAGMKAEGAKQEAAQTEKLEAAVKEIRSTPASEVK